MLNEKLIEDLSEWFDSQEGLHYVHSIGDVESVYREIEKKVLELGYSLEHVVESSDFEELPYDESDDALEVKFEIPIEYTDLMIEFHYHKFDEKTYQTFLDVDFYFDEDSEDDSN